MKHIREKVFKQKVTIDEKLKIMVVGIGKDVGTSTVSIFLAFYLAQNDVKTSFCQLCSEKDLDPYYYLAMDKENDWNSFYCRALEGKALRNVCNLNSNVNWAICLPDDKIDETKLEVQQKLINGLGGKAIVCDCDSTCDKELLQNGDVIIALIDPMPSKILQNLDRLNEIKSLELAGYKVIWVINKMNKGVNLPQTIKSLKLKEYVCIDMFDNGAVYRAQHQGKSLFDALDQDKSFESSIGTIIQRF